MKLAFLGANVLIDYLSARTVEYDAVWAAAIVNHCYKRPLALIVSTHSMMILNHFLAKELQNAKFLRTKLLEVRAVFEIVTVERADIETALNSAMTDFEDAV